MPSEWVALGLWEGLQKTGKDGGCLVSDYVGNFQQRVRIREVEVKVYLHPPRPKLEM